MSTPADKPAPRQPSARVSAAQRYLFLFVLFFFTDASKWAENLTSINRVLLHIVPTSVMFTALLWQARRSAVAGTASARPLPTR